MKKFLVLLICGFVSGAVFAQDNISKSGWYIQALVGANNAGTDNMNIGTFKHNIGLDGSLEGGYVFNPYLSAGLHVQYDRVHFFDEDLNKAKGFNAIEPSLNLYWDMSNTFLGWIPDRKNHVRLYAGVATAFTSILTTGYVYGDKTDNHGVLGYRAGLQYERNLGRNWGFDVDASFNSFGDKFESHIGGGNDSHINLQLGVRKYFGLGSARKHRSDYTRDIVNYVEKRDTIIIKDVLEKPAPKDVYSIFFEIDKIDIRATEVAKIKAVADFMKSHPEKVVFVFGYADKNTGTTQRNNWLAKNRARVICEQLINTYGIDAARIISHDQGDRVQPFTEEEYEKNRSTICVITDLVR